MGVTAVRMMGIQEHDESRMSALLDRRYLPSQLSRPSGAFSKSERLV